MTSAHQPSKSQQPTASTSPPALEAGPTVPSIEEAWEKLRAADNYGNLDLGDARNLALAVLEEAFSLDSDGSPYAYYTDIRARIESLGKDA